MKKIVFIALIVIVIFFWAAYFFRLQKMDNLPESFTLNLLADGTSSGAGRTYSASFVYADDRLIFANASYLSDGQEGKLTCVYEFNIAIDSWRPTFSDFQTNPQYNATESPSEACSQRFNRFSSYLSLEPFVTKEGINKEIADGTIKELESPSFNCRSNWCYEIVEN